MLGVLPSGFINGLVKTWRGDFHYYTDDEADGFDSIEWIAAQRWCNGDVGMEGASYSGTTQLRAARVKAKALKCFMPTALKGGCLVASPYTTLLPTLRRLPETQ